VDSSAGRERSYVFNYYSVRTKDGKELFKVIGMVVAEEDYAKAQEELAELFSKGRSDMGLILSSRGSGYVRKPQCWDISHCSNFSRQNRIKQNSITKAISSQFFYHHNNMLFSVSILNAFIFWFSTKVTCQPSS
jgi:hypothetical protein